MPPRPLDQADPFRQAAAAGKQLDRTDGLGSRNPVHAWGILDQSIMVPCQALVARQDHLHGLVLAGVER